MTMSQTRLMIVKRWGVKIICRRVTEILKYVLVGPTQTLGRRQFDSRDLNRTPSTHSHQERAPGLLPKASRGFELESLDPVYIAKIP